MITPGHETPKRTSDLINFTKKMFPGYQAAQHHLKIAKALEQVEQGHIKRLMIFMPPRHGKSLLTSIHFPAWFLGKNPDLRIIHASYSSYLSRRFSRSARNIVASNRYQTLFPGIQPAKDSRAVDAWDLQGRQGGLICAGIGGSITGFGAHLAIIDDPVKGAAEACSECIRETTKDWYQQDLRTRLENNGRIVICQTRWHEDDLSGWLLRQMNQGGEKWTVLHLPAIQKNGRSLWPKKFPARELKQIQKAIGTYAWEALYQGNPKPPGEEILKRAWFKTCLIDHLPTMNRIVMGVDLAISSKTSADYTVAVPIGIDREGRYYFFRPYRAQAEWPEARREIIHRGISANASIIGIEKVAFQAAAIQDLRREPKLSGILVVDIIANSDKITRCLGWSPLAEQGRIYLVDDSTGWHELFLKECESFPRGKHDDQIDAISIGMTALRKGMKQLHFF